MSCTVFLEARLLSASSCLDICSLLRRVCVWTCCWCLIPCLTPVDVLFYVCLVLSCVAGMWMNVWMHMQHMSWSCGLDHVQGVSFFNCCGPICLWKRWLDRVHGCSMFLLVVLQLLVVLVRAFLLSSLCVMDCYGLLCIQMDLYSPRFLCINIDVK